VTASITNSILDLGGGGEDIFNYIFQISQLKEKESGRKCRNKKRKICRK